MLHKFGILPGARVFTLHPITLGNLLRISRVLLQINYNPDGDFYRESLTAAAQAPKLAYVVAIALTNSDREPGAKLVRWLLNNLTAGELLNILMMVLKQMDLKSFMSSIISLTGMSLLKKGSQIAPGNTSED